MTLQPIVLFISLFLVSPLYGFAPIARHTTALRSTASGVQEFDTNSMTTSEELIPREVLFGNPTYASPQLSPDGKYLSFLAPSPEEDVLNVFVKGTTEPVETARMITDDKSRGIRSAFWAEDSKTILYMQDFEVRIQYNFQYIGSLPSLGNPWKNEAINQYVHDGTPSYTRFFGFSFIRATKIFICGLSASRTTPMVPPLWPEI
jgi:hypothetical protein